MRHAGRPEHARDDAGGDLGLLKPALSEVNMVNAPVIAKERGIRISEVRRDQEAPMRLYQAHRERGSGGAQRGGTVFSNGRPAADPIKASTWSRVRAPYALHHQ